MSTSKDYIAFVLEQLDGIENLTCKQMFGEYMVYVDGKQILLVCDNCVFVKKHPALAELMRDAEEGYPYEGAKPHHLLDIEDRALTENVVRTLVEVTPMPKTKKKKSEQEKKT